ncbi:MAG: hypothetical protein A2020_15020 [Lentisphaerae bacterium GWF2_45_14]|nr:MAG: hypothetical protein A2020_15020 [Lentisphaerae bacterium GWF2_45_14]
MIYINGYSYTKMDGSDGIESLAANLKIAAYRPFEHISAAQKKQMRRTGTFHTSAIKAAVGTGLSRLSAERLQNTAIILVSKFGDQDTTGNFIDDLIDYGMDQGSPIKFAHSNHNTAAAYLAKLLDIGGSGFTIVNFEEAFSNGLELAEANLNMGFCRDTILLQVESWSNLTKILDSDEAGRTAGKINIAEGDGCEAACIFLSTIEDNWNLCELNKLDRPLSESIFLEQTRLGDAIQFIAAVLRESSRES